MFLGQGDGKGACHLSLIINLISETHVRQKGGLDA